MGWDSGEFSKTNENYRRSDRKEAAKKNIWRQKGKKNQVYMLLKQAQEEKFSQLERNVKKISFSN